MPAPPLPACPFGPPGRGVPRVPRLGRPPASRHGVFLAFKNGINGRGAPAPDGFAACSGAARRSSSSAARRLPVNVKPLAVALPVLFVGHPRSTQRNPSRARTAALVWSSVIQSPLVVLLPLGQSLVDPRKAALGRPVDRAGGGGVAGQGGRSGAEVTGQARPVVGRVGAGGAAAADEGGAAGRGPRRSGPRGRAGPRPCGSRRRDRPGRAPLFSDLVGLVVGGSFQGGPGRRAVAREGQLPGLGEGLPVGRLAAGLLEVAGQGQGLFDEQGFPGAVRGRSRGPMFPPG
jgi:hypothetical protein